MTVYLVLNMKVISSRADYLGGSINVLMTVYLPTVYLRIAFFMSVYDPTPCLA